MPISLIRSYQKGLRAGGFKGFKGYEEALASLEEILKLIGHKYGELTQILGQTTTGYDDEPVVWGQSKFRDELMRKLQQDDADLLRIANMNYQIENGGFIQWIDNGYASADYGRLVKVLPKFGLAGTRIAELLRESSIYFRKTNQLDANTGFYPGKEPGGRNNNFKYYNAKYKQLQKDFIVEIAEYYLGPDYADYI